MRKYRITASFFGLIRQRLPTTPHSLVLRMLGTSSFTSAATEWGKKNEQIAIDEYVQYQHAAGHNDLFVCSSGFVGCEDYPFLGASPDAAMYDPTFPEPFGLAEVKCPYSVHHLSPTEACSKTTFFCSLSNDNTLTLKKEHITPKFKDKWVSPRGTGVISLCILRRV